MAWTYLVTDEIGNVFSTTDINTTDKGNVRMWLREVHYYSPADLLPALRWSFLVNYDTAALRVLYRLDLKANVIDSHSDSIVAARTVNTTLSLFEFDCNENKFKIMQASDYYYDGQITTQSGEGQKWLYAAPNTIATAVMKRACSAK
jgi:hypothetical protein